MSRGVSEAWMTKSGRKEVNSESEKGSNLTGVTPADQI